MSFKYKVTHYSFREPNIISESEYLELKHKLQNDPNFSIIDPNDTITNNYSRLFKILIGALISFPISLILMLNEETTRENGFLVIILMVTSLWSIIGLFAFLTSATDLSTYARYLKKKRSYFGRMEIQIKKSKNYDEFFDNFY